jgi:hypothetical protein
MYEYGYVGNDLNTYEYRTYTRTAISTHLSKSLRLRAEVPCCHRDEGIMTSKVHSQIWNKSNRNKKMQVTLSEHLNLVASFKARDDDQLQSAVYLRANASLMVSDTDLIVLRCS